MNQNDVNKISESEKRDSARAFKLQMNRIVRQEAYAAEKKLKGMFVEHWFKKLNLERFI